MFTFTRVHWLHVQRYTGHMYKGTLATCTRVHWLHVQGYTGYMYKGTLATCTRVHWLHVQRYTGYMYKDTLATCTIVHWLHVQGYTAIKTLGSLFFYVKKKIEYKVPMPRLMMLLAIITVPVLTVSPVWSQLSTKHSCLLNTPVVISDGAPD